jgi:N12 class adenine-specific DNA methylase
MQMLTGRTQKQMQRELDSLVYRNPQGEWETADRYLSGDVRAKLKTAEAAAGIDPSYGRNVEALKAVQPADLLPGDISARLGSSWIPASDIKDFICETLDLPKSFVTVSHSGAIATWALTLDGYVKTAVSNTTTYGTPRARATDLIEDALNGRTPTIYDQIDKDTRVVNQQETIAAREAQQKLKDRFSEWIWQDEERAQRLARLYNDRFNNLRLRTFDGSHLTFPGMDRSMLRTGDLDPHQKNAVWRIIQSDNTLRAHCVGAGKTWTSVAAAMEMKRLGLAHKPIIVVPNHLVEQWGAAFLQLYPQANIFVAGKDFFTTGNRQKAMARIAAGNYDAVIVAHKSFESLPVSDETFGRFVGKQIEQLEDAIYEARAEKGDNRRIVKELEKAKKRLTAKLKDRANREHKDDAVTFEQLGADRIICDEADLFKNLGFISKMTRIAGLPNTESNRALDMYMKTQYLAERHGGTVFATGTPISNTMAEMYTLQRYLDPEGLKAAGLEHFDAWAANFGEAVTALELAPDGSGYRMHTRFAKFVNLPELLSMFRSFADVQTADMLKLPRPEIEGGKPHITSAPASPALKEYVRTLVERARKLKSSKIDPSVDNMLKITGDGRKAALDMRLVDPLAEIHGDTKVGRAIENIYRTWEEGKDKRLTQLVFCDLSTPNPDKFNVYDEVRDRLIAKGVPPEEIAYIHEADTDLQKKTLFDSVNAGRIRILLGSTEKMGAGTNVQKRLVALHHLDAPWRPRDIEQREGRILRQGNDNPAVHVHRYVTEGSFDAYMWQCLETKARFINQVMNGSVTVRQAEDLDGGALTYAEIKAIASGNPAVMEKVKVDTEIRKLDQLRASHVNQQHNIRWQVKSLPEQIERDRKYHAGVSADIATRDARAEEDFTMKVGNREFSGKGAREDAGNALNIAVMSWRDDKTLQVRGHYKGFEILSRGGPFKDSEPELYIRAKRHTRPI